MSIHRARPIMRPFAFECERGKQKMHIPPLTSGRISAGSRGCAGQWERPAARRRIGRGGKNRWPFVISTQVAVTPMEPRAEWTFMIVFPLVTLRSGSLSIWSNVRHLSMEGIYLHPRLASNLFGDVYMISLYISSTKNFGFLYSFNLNKDSP